MVDIKLHINYHIFSFVSGQLWVTKTDFLQEAEIEDGSGTKRDKKSDGCNENANGSVKIEDEEKGGSGDNADVKDEKLLVKNETKPPEPSKDYIHVRARRGQATDSHSLAERVRSPARTKRKEIEGFYRTL